MKVIVESVKVVIKPGINQSTGSSYYNIFPERDNPKFDWEAFQSCIRSGTDEVTHFYSVDAAIEYMDDYCRSVGVIPEYTIEMEPLR